MKAPENLPTDTYWPSEKAQARNECLRRYAESLAKELRAGHAIPEPRNAMRELAKLRAQELREAALKKIRSGEGGSFSAPPDFYRRRVAEGESVDPDPDSTGKRLEEADHRREEAKLRLTELNGKS